MSGERCRRNAWLMLACCLVCWGSSAAPAMQADFFVSPEGRDSWSGRLAEPGDDGRDGPFATLTRARDAVRELRKTARGRDVAVGIRGGTYRVDRTVVFGLADSAPLGTVTRYVAFPDETPVFSGSTPVTGWRRPVEPPPRLPQTARPHVWVADVGEVLARKVPQWPREPPELETRTGELLVNGTFGEGTKAWEVWAAGPQESIAVAPGADGGAPCVRLAVTAPGEGGHRLQFRQAVSVAEGGSYTWRFTLSADQSTRLAASLLQQSPPHVAVVSEELEVGPVPREFELSGVSPGTFGAVASFMVGLNGGRTITVQDVSLAGPVATNPFALRPFHATAGRFFTLFEGEDRLPRARGPGFRQPNPRKGWHGASHFELQFPDGKLRDGPDIVDAEVRLIPCAQWIMNLLPVESVDEVARIARLGYPATYGIAFCGAGHRETVWVENLLDHLDSPGEWVLDSRAKLLYLWPRTDVPEGVCAPLLTELIRIEGEVDYEGPADTPVRSLVFEGLTFTQCERYSWHGRTGWGVQHDWEGFDAPSAMVRLRGAEACRLESCRLVGSAAAGLRLDLHAQRNVVQGCEFAHLGGVGVFLCGYGPGAKDVNRRNEVVNNHVHHIGETYWGSPAVFVWQSGENRIAHNTIHHTPYTAVVVSARAGLARAPSEGECSATIRNHEIREDQRGGWQQREPLLHGRRNVLEYNDIYRVMNRLGDGNGIYISGTGRENLVRHNFVHDCPSHFLAEGIRCDDDQQETTILGNVVWGIGGHATGITIKGVNHILNNVIGGPCVPHTARGFISLEIGPVAGSRIERNVLVASKPGHRFVYQRRLYGSGPVPRLRDTEADYNLYWAADDPDRARAFLASEQAHGVEAHSLVGDPELLDPESGDCRFAPGSPARELGIEPVDLRRAGVEEPFRSRLIRPPLTTRIAPAGGVLYRPVKVTLKADRPDAEVRYTLNGTLPTSRSRLYEGRLTVAEPSRLRARAFRVGFADEDGASAVFVAPPQPLRLDVARLPPGSAIPFVTTHEENDRFTVRVAETDGAARKAIRFVDGPGQKYSFDPHLEIPYVMKAGRLTGRIRLRVDAATHLYYQWRRHSPHPLTAGPTFHVRPGGILGLEDGTQLMQIPLEQWVDIEVEGGFGAPEAERFTVRVQLPGKVGPREFTDLRTPGPFRVMDSLFIVAQGTAEAVFEVADVELIPSWEGERE